MTVPDYIISLAVLEEQKYREHRYATACGPPRGPWEKQSGPAAVRKRLRAGLRTLVPILDAPQADLPRSSIPESGA